MPATAEETFGRAQMRLLHLRFEKKITVVDQLRLEGILLSELGLTTFEGHLQALLKVQLETRYGS